MDYDDAGTGLEGWDIAIIVIVFVLVLALGLWVRYWHYFWSVFQNVGLFSVRSRYSYRQTLVRY